MAEHGVLHNPPGSTSELTAGFETAQERAAGATQTPRSDAERLRLSDAERLRFLEALLLDKQAEAAQMQANMERMYHFLNDEAVRYYHVPAGYNRVPVVQQQHSYRYDQVPSVGTEWDRRPRHQEPNRHEVPLSGAPGGFAAGVSQPNDSFSSPERYFGETVQQLAQTVTQTANAYMQQNDKQWKESRVRPVFDVPDRLTLKFNGGYPNVVDASLHKRAVKEHMEDLEKAGARHQYSYYGFMQLELQQALLAKINSSVSNSRRGAPYDLKDLSLGKIPESLTLAAFNGLFENLDVDGMLRAAALLVAKARGTPFDVDILAIPNKFESSNPTFWTTLKKQAESFIEVMYGVYELMAEASSTDNCPRVWGYSTKDQNSLLGAACWWINHIEIGSRVVAQLQNMCWTDRLKSESPNVQRQAILDVLVERIEEQAKALQRASASARLGMPRFHHTGGSQYPSAQPSAYPQGPTFQPTTPGVSQSPPRGSYQAAVAWAEQPNAPPGWGYPSAQPNAPPGWGYQAAVAWSEPPNDSPGWGYSPHASSHVHVPTREPTHDVLVARAPWTTSNSSSSKKADANKQCLAEMRAWIAHGVDPRCTQEDPSTCSSGWKHGSRDLKVITLGDACTIFGVLKLGATDKDELRAALLTIEERNDKRDEKLKFVMRDFIETCRMGIEVGQELESGQSGAPKSAGANGSAAGKTQIMQRPPEQRPDQREGSPSSPAAGAGKPPRRSKSSERVNFVSEAESYEDERWVGVYQEYS